MAFKAHKEFFDASVFLGMHSADDGVCKACKRFFALRSRAQVRAIQPVAHNRADDRRIAVRRHRDRGVLFPEQRRLSGGDRPAVEVGDAPAARPGRPRSHAIWVYVPG
jgi:hypothetical protein